jgi:hypothetical protein
MGVAVCSRATMYNLQSMYVNTAIYSYWIRMQVLILVLAICYLVAHYHFCT